MSTDRLLSEVQRQEKYLAELPENFTFPLFNAQRALESQRRSGYRDTASASREIVDNAYEAGADIIHVVLDVSRNETGRRQGKEYVQSIGFIDNGSGMLPKMAQYALTWGGGTHFDDPSFIGKFGFGLPNASINQTRRVEVYTRVTGDARFSLAVLDTRQVQNFGLQTVEPPVEADLPPFIQKYLDRVGLDLSHGTVVVWINPDRLSYRAPEPLAWHLRNDFGVAYRYLLSDTERPLELIVAGKAVEPVDPLFLTPGARFYLPEAAGGAILSAERFLTLKYYRDPSTWEHHLDLVKDPSQIIADDPDTLALGVIRVRIARFSPEFVTVRNSKSDEDGQQADAVKRGEIRKTRRGISFVRSNREIETVDAFPRSSRDEASGQGHWPLLQSYAYNWAVEIKFEPKLDEVFGITNDKQAVRPIEDLWRVLTEADIDALLRAENDWQRKQREGRKSVGTVHPPGSTPAEVAARDADIAGGKNTQVPDRDRLELQRKLEEEAWLRAEEEAKRRAALTGGAPKEISAQDIEQARKAIMKEAERQPYYVGDAIWEDGPFYKPEWGPGGQVRIIINRWHPFYDVLYSSLLQLPGGERAKEAVDLLLIALGKAELHAEDETMKNWYSAQRKQQWSPFLETALRSLGQRLESMGRVTVEEEDAANVA